MNLDHLPPWLFGVVLTVLVLTELFFLVKVFTPPLEMLLPSRGSVLTLASGCDRLRQRQESFGL